MSDRKYQSEDGVLIEEAVRTEEPPLYRVLLLNDDYTSMEFVVLILESVFKMGSAEAHRVMMSVHKSGSGIAGVYTKEIAETKIALVHHLARQNEFPLKCLMEPE